ncbi:hypothetical protein OJAV_G00234980 [Oryzias javanicus]|uniref:YqaJ viral recombinase domain-containing protein n=1 Tax=Oryzias javanicus TaxID=123683 RepID=A0A3S2LX03_ORYJA|nr:hypothetical protein OJAV_G00234980 [Oryzias javanicus]
MGFESVPLPLSCTSSLQTWHRPRTQGISPEATNDMIVRKPAAKEKDKVKTGVKCTLYKAYCGPLPDPHLIASGEKLKGIHPQLGICKLLCGFQDIRLVESKFGPVPFGSVLSYQCPPDSSRDVIKHPGATEFLQLPVEGYHFTSPTVFNPTSYKHQCHLRSLEVTREISAAIEAETRQQSKSQLWRQVRQPRLTASRFREVCHVRGESSARSLAVRMLKGTAQTAAMKRGLDREEDILWEYADHCDVSVTQCGIIIHPDAPHLGATPDAKVFDPKEMPPFGLAEIKSCDVDDVSQVKHLTTVKGRACLKKTHKYYYQVQGQLAVSGLEWCDFITDTRTDLTVERIFRDDMMNSVRPKLDQFYHEIYVDVYLNSGE